ncbi:5979_t:CDS:2 [Funneliformis caledonium]|uniref:5979_t:CDS:1 n=1 Tax=Funneliformis caledonium TaxID=1117310 RepID=A0A9N9ET17_9GLOM|nr:5979_t:CDS:2 [Funneliformis caledonium]
MSESRKYKITGNQVVSQLFIFDWSIKTREKFLELFKDGHSPSSALYTHENKLYLNAVNEQELLKLLVNRVDNLDYGYISNLFQQYRETIFGGCNGKLIFEHLVEIVKDYNNSN